MLRKNIILFNLLLILLMLFLFYTPAYNQVNKLDTKNLEETMRSPWTAERSGYLKEWQILGGFPITDIKELDSDFLAAHGGEMNMVPAEGWAIKLPDGQELNWQKVHSEDKIIDLLSIFEGGRTEDVIAYAYTTIKRTETEKLILLVASDDGIKIWLNGKEVHRNLVLRAVNLDQDFVPVQLRKGDNHLLLKVHQAKGDWGFAVRMIEDKNDIELYSKTINFQLSHIDPIKKTITIETSEHIESDLPKQDIDIQIYTSGGKTVFNKTVKRSESAIVNYNTWDDGVYEFRFGFYELNGLYRTNYLSWYNGDIIEAARELVNSAPDQNASSPEEITHGMLADMVLDRLEGNIDNPDSSKFSLLHSPLMEFAELKMQKQIRAGGFVRLAYIDEIDGTAQFCRCYLPPKYDPSKKWPLVVFLHGYNAENPEYIRWWSVDKRHDYLVDRYNFIFIEPHGRGNTSYLGIGDKDVLKCIAMAREKFSIDQDRVYLTGMSMGGGGTWHVGSRHPEIFAALAPVYGGWDYHVWMDEEQQKKLGDQETFIYEKSSSAVQFETLLNTPILVLHGDQDPAVDVNFSRYLVRMLQRWEYNVRYVEVPGGGHGDLGTNDLLYPWLLQHKRNKAPKKVRVRAADLRTASAYWVRVIQRNNPWEFINVDAEVLTHNFIRVDSKNVLELILSPDEELVDYRKPLKVAWNGELISFQDLSQNKIILRSKEYRRPQKIYKTPNIAGPINDFTNTPFALVVGTISQDSSMLELIQQKTDILIEDWKNWQKFEPRVYKDIDISQEDINQYSLFLIGGPHENKVTHMISEKIPFTINNDEIKVNDKIFAAKDAVTELIYPHPFNPHRYVRIVAATSFAGMYFYNPRREDFSNYDFYIIDGKIPISRAGFPQEKITLAKGTFNYNWQIDTAYVQEGDPALRAKCATTIVHNDLSTSIKGVFKPDPGLLQSYIGSYKFEGQGIEVKISVENGKLMGQGPDGLLVELHALSECDFFLKEMDVQLSFQKDEETKENILIIYDGNQELRGNKIE